MHRHFAATATFLGLVVGLGGALGAGCRSGKTMGEPGERIPVDPLALAIAADSRLQPDVKLLARAEGETAHIRMQNYTTKAIRVRPENFGVILTGRGKTVVPFDRRIHTSEFPSGAGLEPGQMTSGRITFTGIGDLAGHRLVFNHLHTKMSVALIEGEGAPQMAVPRRAEFPRAPAIPSSLPSAPSPPSAPGPSPGLPTGLMPQPTPVSLPDLR